MSALLCRLVVSTVLIIVTSATQADTVYLKQGSRLQGDIQTMSEDRLELDTDFAGTLMLDRDKVAGVTTDSPIPVMIGNHEQITRRLNYDSHSNQQYLAGPGDDGDVRTLALDRVTSIRPQTLIKRRQRVKAEKYTLPQYATKEQLGKPRWSGAVRLGIDGKSGNTRETNLAASVSSLRSTGVTRLSLLASAERSTSDGQETDADYLGKATYENDFSPRWYGYMEQSVEHDKFQDYGLRTLTTVGPGYFVMRQRRLILKIHGGLGYEYIKHYKDGQHNDRALIASAGWHYAQLFGRSLELSHDFDIYPQLSDDPDTNFSLTSILGASVPIAESPYWKISAQLKHKYKNNPEEDDTDKLDTTYSLAIKRSF